MKTGGDVLRKGLLVLSVTVPLANQASSLSARFVACPFLAADVVILDLGLP